MSRVRTYRIAITEAFPFLPPGTKYIEDVPVHAFGNDVWTRFYQWLEDTHGLEDLPGDGLHDRTYVGDELLKTLTEVVQRSIRASNPKATAKQIEQRVAFSLGDGGPQNVAGSDDNVRFVGKGLFVVPADSEGLPPSVLESWKDALVKHCRRRGRGKTPSSVSETT